MTALSAALGYAKKGWRVFPLVPGQKKPITPHGCKDGTTSPEIIKGWWLRCPDANVGIATGKESNLAVFDFDVKEGKHGKETYMQVLNDCGVIETLMSATPSGGWHVFFQYPDIPVGNRAEMLPGLDIRGEGGYVVAPGSSTEEGAYEWKTRVPPVVMPEPWKQLLVNGKERAESEPFDRKSVLDGVPAGERDNKLYRYVCSLQARGTTEAEAEILVREAANRCKPQFDVEVAMEKVRRVYSQFGQGDKTDETDEPDQQPLPFFKISADFDPSTIPQRDWIIPGLLLRGYMSATLAPGGAGKSIFWLTVAVALASGRDILDQKITKRYRVAVVNNEDDKDELKRRVAAISLRYGIPFADTEENLHLLSGYGKSLVVSKEVDRVVVATATKHRLKTYLMENEMQRRERSLRRGR